jgi:uncharacterized protein (TIGR02611 family)
LLATSDLGGNRLTSVGPAGATPDDNDDRLTWDEVVEAAEEADQASGYAGTTSKRVRAHVAVRMARMSLAVVLLVSGVAMLALPGPGWLVIAAGLAVLSRDVAWAERWLAAVRKRIPGAQPDGSLPQGVWVTIVVATLATASFSIWLVLR